MSRRTRIGFIALILVSKISFAAFAQGETLAALQRSAAGFSSSIAQSLPLNAALGLNWSDAFIGRLFPGLPPSFGVGVSLGFTTIELDAMAELAEHFGFGSLPNITRMPFPAYTAEARVGGLFLPFDVGLKFGILPEVGLGNIELDYLMVGVDIRYAVRDSRLLPISVGIGFNHLRGGIGGSVGSGRSFNFTDPETDAPLEIAITAPNVNFNWHTNTIDFRAQVSQSLLIFTPYLGIGVSHAWSRAGYDVNATVTGPIDRVNAYLRYVGLDEMDLSNTGMSSQIDNNAWGVRLFGGASINLPMFRIDLTGLYSFRDGNYGVSIGFRFQL